MAAIICSDNNDDVCLWEKQVYLNACAQESSLKISSWSIGNFEPQRRRGWRQCGEHENSETVEEVKCYKYQCSGKELEGICSVEIFLCNNMLNYNYPCLVLFCYFSSFHPRLVVYSVFVRRFTIFSSHHQKSSHLVFMIFEALYHHSNLNYWYITVNLSQVLQLLIFYSFIFIIRIEKRCCWLKKNK